MHGKVNIKWKEEKYYDVNIFMIKKQVKELLYGFMVGNNQDIGIKTNRMKQDYTICITGEQNISEQKDGNRLKWIAYEEII